MLYSETKLINVLKSFSRIEMKEFEKFLLSPFHKKSRDVLSLFNALEKFHPDYSSADLNEEFLIRLLNPRSESSGKKSLIALRTLSSALLKSAEDFIFFVSIGNNKVLKNRILLTEFLDRNLLKYYEPFLPTAYTSIKEAGKISGADDLEEFYLERLNTRYYYSTLEIKKSLEHSLKAEEVISSYFLINLLRTAVKFQLGNVKVKVKDEKNVIEGLMNGIKMEEIIKIYEGTPQYVGICFNYYSYMCLKNNLDPHYYEKAKKIFFDNKENINRRDKCFYYADLMNVINEDSSADLKLRRKEAMNLLESCLQDKAYKISDDDHMHPDFYRNTIIESLIQKLYDWGINFIEEYSCELPPKFRETMKMYSMAMVYYGKGEFERSLECIVKVKYELLHSKMDVKILMLKIFYELRLTEQAYSLIDTFKHYLKNEKKLPDVVKISCMNFLKYYSKIVNPQVNKDELYLLKQEMLNETHLFQKSWLRERM